MRRPLELKRQPPLRKDDQSSLTALHRDVIISRPFHTKPFQRDTALRLSPRNTRCRPIDRVKWLSSRDSLPSTPWPRVFLYFALALTCSSPTGRPIGEQMSPLSMLKVSKRPAVPAQPLYLPFLHPICALEPLVRGPTCKTFMQLSFHP
jgi:hypothetical protein